MQQSLLLLEQLLDSTDVWFKILMSNACIVILLNISKEKFRSRRVEHTKKKNVETPNLSFCERWKIQINNSDGKNNRFCAHKSRSHVFKGGWSRKRNYMYRVVGKRSRNAAIFFSIVLATPRIQRARRLEIHSEDTAHTWSTVFYLAGAVYFPTGWDFFLAARNHPGRGWGRDEQGREEI